MWPGACVMARGSLACMTAVCGVTPHLFGVARPGLGVTQVSGDIQLLPALFVCRRAGRAWPKARTLCRSCSHTLCACGDHRRGKATCKARKWQAAAAAAGGGGRDAQKTGISSSLMSTPSPKSGCKLQSRVSAAMPSTYAGQATRLTAPLHSCATVRRLTTGAPCTLLYIWHSSPAPTVQLQRGTNGLGCGANMLAEREAAERRARCSTHAGVKHTRHRTATVTLAPAGRPRGSAPHGTGDSAR